MSGDGRAGGALPSGRGRRAGAGPDVDGRPRRWEVVRTQGPVLAVIALGGGFGALARYELARALPTPPGGFPRATFATNVLGCLLIGALMVLVTELRFGHRLARPFLGVGVLGGFTTFSSYALEFHELLRPGSAGLAFAYLGATPLCAMLSVLLGAWITRTAPLPRSHRRGERIDAVGEVQRGRESG